MTSSPARAPARAVRRPRQRPCALTIAGLDPSGGAGLAADLRGFQAAGAWGCAACAVLTVQSTAGLRSALPTPPEQLRAQIDEVLAHQRVRALKTGALGSTDNVRVVIETLRAHPALPSVVDPVMMATRSPDGARLLDPEALDAMRSLCSLATVVTPNVDEAEALLASTIRDGRDQREAALTLQARGPRAVLLKGGHLPGPQAIDVLVIEGKLMELASPRRQRAEFHGGGCLLAALVAGHLAVRRPPYDAFTIERCARQSKRLLERAVVRALDVGDGLLVPAS